MQSDPTGTPGAGTGGTSGSLEKIRISELIDEARSRTVRGGYTYLSKGATQVLVDVGKAHGINMLIPWISLHTDKDGCLYVTPTDENDEDKLPVRWDGTQFAHFSLNKVFKKKNFKIPRGHALVMDCAYKDHPDLKAALQMKFEGATLEPVNPKRTPAHSEAAAAKQPPAQ